MRAPATSPLRVYPTRFERAFPALALAIAAIFVWRGALELYFSQDDFVGLGRAAGVAARLTGPWRLLSAQFIFDALRPVAGLQPLGYHLASLLFHLTCSTLLYIRLARPVRSPAALVGTAFFTLHYAIFTALYWVSAIADPMAALFVLLTVIAWRGVRPVRWLAVPFFVLALMCKESAIPLPLALLALARDPRRDLGIGMTVRRLGHRLKDPVWITLTLLAAADAAYFVIADSMGSAHDSRPYAIALGETLWRNGLTYLGWMANAWLPTVKSFSESPDPSAWPWGLGLLLLWLLGLLNANFRRRGWFAAGVWSFAFLVPVLPLENHTYHYYLYLPLIGASVCIAIVVDTVFARWIERKKVPWDGSEQDLVAPRGFSPVPEWIVAVILIALFATNSLLLVRRIETAPFVIPGHLSDTVVDRAAIARRVIDGIKPHLPPDSLARVMVWTLPPADASGSTRDYLERNLRSALYDGVALRVMLPQVVEVGFAQEFRPLSSEWRWVLARSDGESRVLEPAAFEQLVRQYGPPR